MIKNWCPKYIKNSQSSTEKSAWGGGTGTSGVQLEQFLIHLMGIDGGSPMPRGMGGGSPQPSRA